MTNGYGHMLPKVYPKSKLHFQSTIQLSVSVYTSVAVSMLSVSHALEHHYQRILDSLADPERTLCYTGLEHTLSGLLPG